MQRQVADLSARQFNDQIGDPDIFCGGGSVAALSAAGAAATALLVMRLNVKRKSNADQREQIQAAIDRTASMIDDFYAAADSDITTLDELLATQRAMRSGGPKSDYLAALTRAAESPLHMGELILGLLDAIEGQLAISTRFTISDLGAAAVLAEGAGRAALLTAEVNIALLGEADDANTDVTTEMDRRRNDIRQRISDQSARIEETSRMVVRGDRS